MLVNLGTYRAKSIKDYLVKKGISSERLTTDRSDQPAAPGLSMLSLLRIESRIIITSNWN